jgi:hypothetical protein
MATPARRWIDAWFRACERVCGVGGVRVVAVSRDAAGGVVTLAGVSVLRFDADGRVVDQRDYWSQETGARQPPEDWGPVARHGSTAE